MVKGTFTHITLDWDWDCKQFEPETNKLFQQIISDPRVKGFGLGVVPMERYTCGLNSVNPLISGRASICVVYGTMTLIGLGWT